MAAVVKVLQLAEVSPRHILIEHVIKRALIACGAEFSPNVKGRISQLALPGAGIAAKRTPALFEKYGDHDAYKPTEFRFDAYTVLPSWYNDALHVSSDLTADEFMQRADQWIVGEIQGGELDLGYNNEPRSSRFQGESDWGDDDPRLLRYSRYLQWHAMFVVVRDFMDSRSVFDPGDDLYDGLCWLLAKWDVSASPLWLSDLRQPKPLERRFWFEPPYVQDEWLDQTPCEAFETEARSEGKICLASKWSMKTLSYGRQVGEYSVEVNSALVSPDTAGALLRALQVTPCDLDFFLDWESETGTEGSDASACMSGQQFCSIYQCGNTTTPGELVNQFLFSPPIVMAYVGEMQNCPASSSANPNAKTHVDEPNGTGVDLPASAGGQSLTYVFGGFDAIEILGAGASGGTFRYNAANGNIIEGHFGSTSGGGGWAFGPSGGKGRSAGTDQFFGGSVNGTVSFGMMAWSVNHNGGGWGGQFSGSPSKWTKPTIAVTASNTVPLGEVKSVGCWTKK